MEKSLERSLTIRSNTGTPMLLCPVPIPPGIIIASAFFLSITIEPFNLGQQVHPVFSLKWLQKKVSY